MTHQDALVGPEVLQQVDTEIQRQSERARQLLVDLVKVPSVNPEVPGIDGREYVGGEQRANEIVADAFAPLGYDVDWVEVASGRPNLVAVRPGVGAGPSLAFNGHIDTVAPQSGRYDDPWTPVIDDGFLYGLGSTDMKAGHAAIWLAAAALHAAGVDLRGDLQLHSVVGEETMSHEIGSSAVVAAGHHADGVVVAEPTSPRPRRLDVANAAAGNHLFSVTVRGKSTHWASRGEAIRAGGVGDEIGVNAIDKAVYIYQAMRQLEEQWAFTKVHDAFRPGSFIIHPGVWRADIGIEAAPYFPDRARIDYLLSFPPGETAGEVRAEVESHISRAASLDPWLREHPVEFEWKDTWPPAFTDPELPFSRSVIAARRTLQNVDERIHPLSDPVTATAQSDANFYEAAGIPALVCGPGDVRHAHAADERVELAAVDLAARLFARIAIQWCGVA